VKRSVSAQEVSSISPKIRLRSADGTVKYVWSLPDESTTESVFVRLPRGNAVCVSSQVGCSLACGFCASGLDGVKRNLTAEEIVAQITGMFEDQGPPGRPFEVGFMGMGEPMLNLDAVKRAVELVHAAYPHLQFALSTVGYPSRFPELLEFAAPVRLQVSLHAPSDALRRRLIPRPDHSIAAILAAMARYDAATAGRVEPLVLNYLLFEGVNDSDEHARELTALLDGFRGQLRVARFNPIPELPFKPSSGEREQAFVRICREAGVWLYHFHSLGTDVAGGCGQLRARFQRTARRQDRPPAAPRPF
jgi:23S rRNA (adenine2503-C2)-methyltransferase